MAAKGKRTFWITGSATSLHQDRANLLLKHGFDVIFLKDVNEVNEALQVARPSCVLIDTPNKESKSSNQIIQTVSTMPELNGVRFILSVTNRSHDALKVAVAENFRDIIHLRTPEKTWLQRIQFATATKPTEFPSPLCEISLNQIAVAIVPARIIWINDTHMRIECRGNQRVGTSLQLSGTIATSFGVPHISLTVESIHKDQLKYRFSQALVCRWRVAATNSANAAEQIKRITINDSAPKLRAFIAATRSEIRKTVISTINQSKFEVKVGLQKGTLTHELGYFSPDVVFLDDKLVETLSDSDIHAMFKTVANDVPVIIYASSKNTLDFKSRFGSRPVYVETKIDIEHLAQAHQRYRIVEHFSESSFMGKIARIDADHPWSRVDIHIPARLTSLNPAVGIISLPHSIGAFTIAKLEAPILRRALGRDPFIKITQINESSNSLLSTEFAYHAHFYLVEIDHEEQLNLANMLAVMVTDYYKKQFSELAAQDTKLQNLAVEQMPVIQMNAAQVISGNLALKEPPITITNQGTDKYNQLDINKSLRSNNTYQSNALNRNKSVNASTENEISLDSIFYWRKKIDPVVIKALIFFLIFSSIMGYIIHSVSNIDESYYKDHGKEYSDFIIRMTDPANKKRRGSSNQDDNPP